ncbi:MAG: Cro/Cl family transcriptional regulator [Halomonadaceae bacterium]|nr:Cro/Cl family transcriptional regulator [Halomonadaceae bacterium]
MKTADAIQYFGGKKKDLAKALGLSPSAITQWGDSVPPLRQYELERITGGKLKAPNAAA